MKDEFLTDRSILNFKPLPTTGFIISEHGVEILGDPPDPESKEYKQAVMKSREIAKQVKKTKKIHQAFEIRQMEYSNKTNTVDKYLIITLIGLIIWLLFNAH